MRKLFVAGWITVAAALIAGCAGPHAHGDGKAVVKLKRPRLLFFFAQTAGPVGHISFSYSAPNASFGNGKVTCVVNGTDHGTRWRLYTGSTPPATATLLPGAIVSADPLIQQSGKITATLPASVIQPGVVPVYTQKLTTMTVTYTQ